MKLVIPPECQIAASTFDIVTNDWLLRKLEDRASMNLKEQKIRLPKNNIKAQQTFTELIHEILHIVDDTIGVPLEEGITTARGNLLSQALLSLGIEPDFSKIPEEEV